jgi:hypothetical protein
MFFKEEENTIAEYFSNSAEEIKDEGILKILEKEKRKIGLENYSIVLFAAEIDKGKGGPICAADVMRSRFKQNYDIWIYPVTFLLELLDKKILRKVIRHELFHIKSDVLNDWATRSESDVLQEEKDACIYHNR